uniref:Uncharacterized protein n=1 Tax=viral metagenome TaxID=1070528 RepID=A0A6M3L244_9ZZZZ
MDNKEEKVKRMRTEIEKSKSDLSRLFGQKDVLLQNLKSKYNIETVEEAIERSVLLKEERDQLEIKFDSLVKEIESKYEF